MNRYAAFGYATVRAGSSGPDVVALQTALNNAYGQTRVAIDGKFGPATGKALIGFQVAHGLTGDAIAGAKTWAALGPYLASGVGPMPLDKVTIADAAANKATPPAASGGGSPSTDADVPGSEIVTGSASSTLRKVAIAGGIFMGAVVFFTALGGSKNAPALNGYSGGRSRRRGFAGRITLAQAKKEASAIGITISKVDGEYRVKPKGGTEAQTYFTNDIEDAIGTARLMANGR